MIPITPEIQQNQLPEILKNLLNDRLNVSLTQITEFCQYWNIIEFALFGSVLRDDFRLDSDIDILVTFSPDYRLTFKDWMAMKQQIEELFERKVDLTQKELLKNPYTRSEILKTHKVIYAAEQP
ncbi:MAG: nucleotidyltransferase domain-containing protein [Geitlerinemataceae cyanobacterium]